MDNGWLITILPNVNKLKNFILRALTDRANFAL